MFEELRALLLLFLQPLLSGLTLPGEEEAGGRTPTVVSAGPWCEAGHTRRLRGVMAGGRGCYISGLVLSLEEGRFPSLPETFLRFSPVLLLVGDWKPKLFQEPLCRFQIFSHSHLYKDPGLFLCYSTNPTVFQRDPLDPQALQFWFVVYLGLCVSILLKKSLLKQLKVSNHCETKRSAPARHPRLSVTDLHMDDRLTAPSVMPAQWSAQLGSLR